MEAVRSSEIMTRPHGVTSHKTAQFYIYIVKMETISSYETLGTICQTTRCHKPENHNLNFYCREDFWSHIKTVAASHGVFQILCMPCTFHPCWFSQFTNRHITVTTELCSWFMFCDTVKCIHDRQSRRNSHLICINV